MDLFELIRTGNSAEIFAAFGANPSLLSATDSHGRDVLFFSLAIDRPELLEMMLDAGADPRVAYGLRGTLLHVAIELGHAQQLPVLIRAAPELLKHCNSKGQTPLHVAARAGNQTAIKVLLDAGANSDTTDAAGHNYHDHLTMRQLRTACKEGDVAELRRLLSQGAALVNEQFEGFLRNDSCATPLCAAAKAGHAEAVELLLDYKADPSIPGKRSMAPPLNGAAVYGHVDVVRLLVVRGADINQRDADPKHGATALHEAIAAEEAEAVKTLVELGADVNATDADGLTPLDWVYVHMEEPHDEILAILLQAGGKAKYVEDD